MAATPSGDTKLCVDYDNYSPRYSPTVIANVMNNVMIDQRAISEGLHDLWR